MSSDDLSEDRNEGPDGEGVWSPDIEQSFQEALLMYPPCGRRKIIINDDAGGKMYGRNELIARYIKLRTGKTRSRKQVSSHIQVLARRKAKETHQSTTTHNNNNNNIITSDIGTQKLRLIEFSAFMKQQTTMHPNDIPMYTTTHTQLSYHNHLFIHINQKTQTLQHEPIDILEIQDKFANLKDLYDQGPKDAFFLVKCWADLNEHELDTDSFYGFSSHLESNQDMLIFCSTKVCSFGKVAAELDVKLKAVCKNGRYSYYFHPQPMCNYMVEFIRKLRELPQIDMMNSVLENFTILKVVKDHATDETLLCIAFIFEVSQNNGATHNIYKLTGT